MKPKEVRGISSSNTIRRVRNSVTHHGKGIVCDNGPNCWSFTPKKGEGMCKPAGVKWGYSARNYSRTFRDGFDSKKRPRCAYHGHRMCGSPIANELTIHKKRVINTRLVRLNNLEVEDDPYEYYYDDEIPEEIEYEDEKEIPDIDAVYAEYKKMRLEEIDLDAAYAAYEKMKDDEWIFLENEN
ncbi:MAG: hypothetical protein PHG66_00165 [Candidatus Colwellbacteria bacterium]|nr:hypothetical protein [Candidatus Colwellbacteria bacterium]